MATFTPNTNTALAAGVGAAGGAAAVGATMYARRVASMAAVGLGVAIAAGAAQVSGGNANYTQAQTAANLTNTINGRTFGATYTPSELVALRGDVASLSAQVAQVAANTDPMTALGIRSQPVVPVPNYAAAASQTVSTTPPNSLGNLGTIAIVGLGIWLLVRD